MQRAIVFMMELVILMLLVSLVPVFASMFYVYAKNLWRILKGEGND